MNKFIGKKLKILIEIFKDGYSYGHSTNYLNCKIEGVYPSNEYVDVEIIGVEYPNVIGKPVE